jgi:hypothetical protein
LLSSRKRTLNLSVSGNRSASAANALAKPGYTNVWNPVEGHADGKRLAKCRLPWPYKLTADQAWVPSK